MRHSLFATIVITALALLISNPANAIETSLQKSGRPLVSCLFTNGNVVSGGDNRCIVQINEVKSTSLSQILITDGVNPVNVANGDLIQVVLSVRDNTLPPGIYHRFAQMDSPGYQLVSIDGFNFSSGATTNITNNPNTPNNAYTVNSIATEFLSLTYRCTNSSGCSGLSLGKPGGVFLAFHVADVDTGITIQVLSLNYLSLVDSESESELADKELEGQENIENQDTSGTNQGVSDDNYSSLLDIFSGFITAISGVSPGSCSISLATDMGNFGNVDLCAVDPPSWIQTVGSIIVILLFVPCSMALINRILKTIQEFQQ